MPDWARELQATQAARHRHQLALQAIRDGDHGGASASPDISEKEN
jgi:type IV secretion system protein TrbL